MTSLESIPGPPSVWPLCRRSADVQLTYRPKRTWPHGLPKLFRRAADGETGTAVLCRDHAWQLTRLVEPGAGVVVEPLGVVDS